MEGWLKMLTHVCNMTGVFQAMKLKGMLRFHFQHYTSNIPIAVGKQNVSCTVLGQAQVDTL